jgi:hypothetical protein
MLSAKGNPTMDDLTNIINVLCKKLNVDIKVNTVSAAKIFYLTTAIIWPWQCC